MRRVLRVACLTLVTVLASGWLFGQSYDRLTIRPRRVAGSYEPGKISFAASSAWPTADPEVVTLAAPAAVTLRYDLSWPPAAPVVPSCVAVATTGQMSFVACGAGIIHLDPGAAVLLDEATGNESVSWSRETSMLAGVDAFWVELRQGLNEHVQWTFAIPTGFTSLPTLTIWGDPSNGEEFTALMRCATPVDLDSWDIKPWDSANTGTLPTGGGLGTAVITLTNNSNVTDLDICQVDLEMTSGGGIVGILWAEIE